MSSRAPAPPIPSKGPSTSTSSSTSIFSDSNAAVNQDLAQAVRDSVQIRDRDHPASNASHSSSLPPPPHQPNTHTNASASAPGSKRSSLLGLGGVDNSTSTSPSPGHRPPRLPSLDPLVPRRTPSPNPPPPAPSSGMGPASRPFVPTHSHSLSSPDINYNQPALPSARLQQMANPNPFEEDEIEPPAGRVRPPVPSNQTKPLPKLSTGIEAAGVVQPTRAKFTRAQTGATTSTSSSANLLGPASPNGGVGSAAKTRPRRSMSTDSYPFGDAPVVKELTAGQKKALEDKKGSRHADVIDTWDPTGLGSAMWHHSGPYDAAAPSRNVNAPNTKAPMQAFNGVPVQSPPRTGPTTISLSPPPAPPAKDLPDAQERPAQRRVHTGRQPSASRRVSGGLTGQYSTSMPTSGGYFPDPSEPMDEAAMARKERAREREQKRRALKAAWGIDEPEPFEDFGASPNDGTVELAEDSYSPDAFGGAHPNKPMRSPGLKLGLGPRTPSVQEESTSPTNDYPLTGPRSGNYFPPAGNSGVKRNKSLMQKFKTMRDGPRSSSPRRYSPSNELPPSNNVSSPSSEVPSDNSTPSISAAAGGVRRPGILKGSSGGYISPQKSNSVPGVPALPVESPLENDGIEDDETIPDGSGSGFVLVESPSSKARAMRALQKEHAGHTHGHGVPVNRTKHLPMPPVKPVIPTFDDLLPPSRKMSRSPLDDGANGLGSGPPPVSGNGSGGEGLKRKTSMVKKLRDRMGK